MVTAPFSVFDPIRLSMPETGDADQGPTLLGDAGMNQQERAAAILTDKLPRYEQEYDRGEVTLANWLALMSL